MNKGIKVLTLPPYPPVRALDRGLKLIEQLSESGWSTPQSLSRTTGIDRSTVYRMLSTLVNAGYVARRGDDGQFVLSGKLREIASGVRQDDQLIGIISPLLVTLVNKVFWPSDFGILSGGRLRIVASSHHLTSMTIFRGLVGKERSVVSSALGRAILTAMSEPERELALTALGTPFDRAEVDRAVTATREAGYASAIGTTVAKISAIALPVNVGDRVVGAINLVFFRSALSPTQAATKHLEQLRATVKAAELELARLYHHSAETP